MHVGFVGLGKLGLPVATTLAACGHQVTGYDPFVDRFPEVPDAQEVGWSSVLDKAAGFRFGTLAEVCQAEVVFVAVQTPHEPAYEGTTIMPRDRKDFDYAYLRDAVHALREVADIQDCKPTVAIISTVLPGTMRREVVPLLGDLPLVYNPSFIAMGTVVEDFLNPEFVLLGGEDDAEVAKVAEVYREAGVEAPTRRMSVESAELTKVAYNTFIGAKLAFANTLGEICHGIPEADVDDVSAALAAADRRLISPAYLTAGMGDGGGCHPRDNIALSWFAREHGLSFDLFDAIMRQRQRHANWLAGLMRFHAPNLKRGILGIAYKPCSALTTGSPALLVADCLRDPDLILRDPYVEGYDQSMPVGSRCWLIGCKHPEFQETGFPEGSVIIDPWRYIPDQEGIEVIRIGEVTGTRRSHLPLPPVEAA